MAELIHRLFYLSVLALIVGCGAYLYVTRRKDTPDQGGIPEISPEALKEAEGLSGTYRLSDLESILTRLFSLGAWGVVLQLHLAAVKDNVEAIIEQNAVVLFSNNLGVLGDHLDRFRRAAERAGLEAHSVADQADILSVRIAGSCREIAATITLFVAEIYGLDENAEADLTIFK